MKYLTIIPALALGACSPVAEEATDEAAADVDAAADAGAVVGAAAADAAGAVDAGAIASAAPADDGLTGPQTNALRNAREYIQMSGFSRAGLIDQLSSEYGSGYSVADATAAVDSLNVDWNEQAARSAREYIQMSGFSCQGLIEQLSSDSGSQYTQSQAEFGAQQAGAC